MLRFHLMRFLKIKPYHRFAYPELIKISIGTRDFESFLIEAKNISNEKNISISHGILISNQVMSLPMNIIKTADAIKLTQKVLSAIKNKSHPRIRLIQARLHLKANEDKKAEKIVDQIITTAKGSTLQESKVVKVMLLYKQQKYVEAYEYSKKLSVVLSQNMMMQRMHGIILKQTGDIDGAKDLFRGLLKKSNYADSIAMLELFKMLDEDRKEEELFKFWDTNPRSHIAFSLAFQFYKTKNNTSAIKDLAKKLTLVI